MFSSSSKSLNSRRTEKKSLSHIRSMIPPGSLNTAKVRILEGYDSLRLQLMREQDMKGEFGRMRSRSHRVVEECPVTVVDALRQSCWANMPSELLRDKLERNHEGDCKKFGSFWKIELPYFLEAASNDDGKFLLAARRCRRPTYTDYVISLNADDVSKGSSSYIGKLRSNFLGTKFTIYDAQPPNFGAKVTKSRSTRGPRRMQCIMDAIPASAIEPEGVAPTQTAFLPGNFDSFPTLPFFRSKSTRTDSFRSGPLSTLKDEMLVLKNKAPRWHEQLQCWCLNFNGRVTVASVKNFQLVASLENGAGGQEQQENVVLQFGKVGKDIFTMDYQYPISAFQAFAICLSSFDTKIACE
ncbi:hypothetical protein DH2020_046134 [Rehmannia glutinosa]|uniref:Tubby C-terminal domain-containing protein n=1 Tax=Rehmannia glutinosa TaxID=99300 RepID=A0ABR0UC52_REHGL